jgi:hypothetical protein
MGIVRPFSVAESSKARVYGRWLDGVAGSSPTRGMDVCVVSKDKNVKCRTIKTKTQVRMKYKQSTRECRKIPPVACMSVCCECFVMSGTGFCDRSIPRPEKFY